MLPLFKTAMGGTAATSVAAVLNSGHVGEGDRVKWFESALAEHLGNANVVTVNSASSGLHLALHMLDLPFGSKVLTTPLTCTATNWAIRANWYEPAWADVNPRTLNICLQDVRSRLDEDTRVLMLVHWGGYPIDLDDVAQVKKEYESTYHKELHVVEDCAHAWGSRFRGKPLGNHGNAAVYSFGPVKTLTCGDGGLMVFPNHGDRDRAKRLRWYGIPRDDRDSDVTEWGYKFHMNDINAAIGTSNLENSKALVWHQRQNGRFFDEQLKNIPGLKTLERRDGHNSSSWLYTVLVEDRPNFMLKMMSSGIEAKPVHRRNDEYACVRPFRRDLPCLDSVYPNIVCVPCGWWLSYADRSKIVNTIRSGW